MLGRIRYQWNRLKKNCYIVIIGIISLFLIVGGLSYALFTSSAERRGSLNIVTGELTTKIESKDLDESNSIEVKSGESREITVVLNNENSVEAKFLFYYETTDRISVSYDSKEDEPPKEEGSNIERNGSRTYRLKIANNTDKDENITFGSKVGLKNKEIEFPSGKKVVEGIIPVVDTESNMIKVVWNEQESTWVKADDKTWYDYDFGKWANAVTVTTASRSKYQSATSGTAIAMSDIETMWIYIPRYSYTIGSEDGTNYYGKKGVYLNSTPTLSLPGEIDVKFIKRDEKESGSAQYKVAEKRNGWRTPDGFTFGDEELSGIWVGKFETSSSNPDAQHGGGNTIELDAIIKPNVISWRWIQIVNIAGVGRNITKNENRYGFNSSKLNSHVMKADEWAITAYLSQSKYGKLGNREFSGEDKEIYINKSNEFITGCSYGRIGNDTADYGCHYTYEKAPEGIGSSTTGTIYGIYDMSGGGWEYVMANYAPNGNKYSGNSLENNSGYIGLLTDGSSVSGKEWLENKYYNFYNSDNLLTICNGAKCTSHALNETTGWYNDSSILPSAKLPWMFRGGCFGDSKRAGVFFFGNYYGTMGTYATFRLVLSEN